LGVFIKFEWFILINFAKKIKRLNEEVKNAFIILGSFL